MDCPKIRCMLEELEVLKIVSELRVPTGGVCASAACADERREYLDRESRGLDPFQARLGERLGSELQRRDVRTLVDKSMDRAYLQRWAARFGVADAVAEILQ